MVRWVGLLVVLLGFSVARPAHAIFYHNRIVEVFPGTADAPNAQYVEMEMSAAGEGMVTGIQLTLYDATGAVSATSTFTSDLTNAASQARFLVATTEAQALFDLTADLTLTGTIPLAGGKICYSNTIDCVAWGNYSGSSTGVGTPFEALSGLVAGQAMKRRQDIFGAPDTLELEDDTDDCANDFVLATPSPVNNGGVVGLPLPSDGEGGAAGAAGDNAGAPGGNAGGEGGVPGTGGSGGSALGGQPDGLGGDGGPGGEGGVEDPGSGGSAAGGMTATGGRPTGSGGTASGGLKGSGGKASGGAPSSAGKSSGSSAGNASGGRSGASSASGGKGGSPSAGHAGTTPAAAPADSGGCGCTVPARRSSTPAALGLVLALGLLRRRSKRVRAPRH